MEMNKIKKHTLCKVNHIYRHLLAGMVIVLFLFAAGCSSDQAPGAASENGDNIIVNGKDVETVTDGIRTNPEGIPQIDGQIPEELETATLAMG